jgi:hypothetical protein
VTKPIVEKIIQICGAADNFFTQCDLMAEKKPGICPEAKVLIALKQLSYGVSCSAFQDYFHMGETTGREALKRLAKCIANLPELCGKYLRNMSREDAKRVSKMHLDEFGT